MIKTHTLSLLLEVPGHQLPYFKFRELCERRFKISPSFSDLHEIRDVSVVTEEATGRTISLNPDLRNSPSRLLANVSDRGTPAEQPYCKIHWKPTKLNNEKGWAELEILSLPNVKIELAELSKNVHLLLEIHNNFLLLARCLRRFVISQNSCPKFIAFGVSKTQGNFAKDGSVLDAGFADPGHRS